METIKELLGLGFDAKSLEAHQVCLRAVVVFFSALIMVRISHRRFLAKISAFDVILGIVLASMLSRSINGSAALISSILGAFVLVLLHRFLATAAYHWDPLGWFLKGEPDVLVSNGKADPQRLRAHSVSENDLLEEARLNGQVETIEEIRLAVMERNGHISVLPKRLSN